MAAHRKPRGEKSTAQANGMRPFPGTYIGDHRQDRKLTGVHNTQAPRQERTSK